MKLVKLILSILTLSVALAGSRDTLGQIPNFFTGSGSTTSWDDPNNWNYGIVPVNAFTNPQGGWDDPNFCPIPGVVCYPLTPDPNDDFPNGNNNAMFNTDDTSTVIDSSVYAKAYGVRVGLDGASNTLLITGGRLDVGVSPDGMAGNGGAGWHLDVGRGFNRDPNSTPNPLARVIMSGGTVNTNLVKIPEQFVDSDPNVDPVPDPNNNYDTAPISGELIMTGGTMNARKINVGQFVGNGNAVFSGSAVINLFSNVPGNPANGGFLEMKQDWFIGGQPVATTGDAHIDISENAIFTITGHKNELLESPNQDEVDRYQGYVDNGWLTADDGTDVPTIYFDGSSTIKICALDADFDSDCDVDDVDKATWEANYGLGSGALKTEGDANNDGRVDALDFHELQREYGVGIGSGSPLLAVSTVPEPASIWLLAPVGAAASGLRRRTRLK